MRKLLVVYDSISGNTERMAKFMMEGANRKLSKVILKNVEDVVEQDLIDADAIAFGCPTYNRDLTSGMKDFFEVKVAKVKGKLRGKIGIAFGAYGWSAEAIRLIQETLKYLKMNVIELDQGSTGTPDEDYYITSLSDIERITKKFGEDIATKVKSSKRKKESIRTKK
ncbi:MAG: flavodoxin domain-containing protein [Candidatus Bathyarchaeota archaeon]|nr:flavodoxin domain-containing protein [Candidatus Bathyarchaeota archaeon]